MKTNEKEEKAWRLRRLFEVSGKKQLPVKTIRQVTGLDYTELLDIVGNEPRLGVEEFITLSKSRRQGDGASHEARVMRCLKEAREPITLRTIIRRTVGGHEKIKPAVERLVEKGMVKLEETTNELGSGRKKLYSVSG